MFLYTVHGSSGTRHTSDELHFYFTDVEHPTAESPVKKAINLVVFGVDSSPEYGNVEIISKMTINHEEAGYNNACFMFRFDKKYLIAFLGDIQVNGYDFVLSDGEEGIMFNAIQVDINSPSFYTGYYPSSNEDCEPIKRNFK